MEEKNFVSLFDFLGRSAGKDLGKEVYTKAKELKKSIQQKNIVTSKYSGKVMMYEHDFLVEYFKPKESPVSLKVEEDDNLPF